MKCRKAMENSQPLCSKWLSYICLFLGRFVMAVVYRLEAIWSCVVLISTHYLHSMQAGASCGASKPTMTPSLGSKTHSQDTQISPISPAQAARCRTGIHKPLGLAETLGSYLPDEDAQEKPPKPNTSVNKGNSEGKQATSTPSCLDGELGPIFCKLLSPAKIKTPIVQVPESINCASDTLQTIEPDGTLIPWFKIIKGSLDEKLPIYEQDPKSKRLDSFEKRFVRD